jgi:hypothetical protein
MLEGDWSVYAIILPGFLAHLEPLTYSTYYVVTMTTLSLDIRKSWSWIPTHRVWIQELSFPQRTRRTLLQETLKTMICVYYKTDLFFPGSQTAVLMQSLVQTSYPTTTLPYLSFPGRTRTYRNRNLCLRIVWHPSPYRRQKSAKVVKCAGIRVAFGRLARCGSMSVLYTARLKTI